jgi:aryl-alcohol dehydrogenase-like predicted oxidoreductase
MIERSLGRNGPKVGALGLGCMGMSPDWYRGSDESESIATIQAAIDAGVTLLNTGDFYGMGHNEMLIGRAIAGRRHRVFISVKCGLMRAPDGQPVGFDTRPQAIKNFVTYSLRRLRTDYLDLYQPARVDAIVPIEETVGAIADLVKAGYVRHIGLSEAGPGSIARAHAVYPLTSVEVEYSLMGRDVERNVLPAARKLGIGIVAYNVLAGGLLGGRVAAGPVPAADFRSHMPRFLAGNLERNLDLVAQLAALAQRLGMTTAQLAIAWVLARGEDIVPLAGARSRERLREAVGALAHPLDAEAIEAAALCVPAEEVAGSLYGGHMQDSIDRERAGGGK